MDVKFVITKYNDIMLGCLINEGKLEDIRCYEENSLIGNIYVAKVSNILNNINAAFVDIKKDVSGYLPLEDYRGKPLKVGDELIVQVTKDSIKTKQPTVTTNISMAGEYVVVHCDKTVGVSAKIKGEAVRNTLKDIAGRALEEFKENRLCTDVEYGVILRTKCRDIVSDVALHSGYNNQKKSCDNLMTSENSNILYNDIMSTTKKLDELLKKAKYLKLYSVVKAGEPAYIKDLVGMSDDIGIITDVNSVYEALCDCYGKDCGRISFYEDDSISLNSIYNIPVTIEKSLKKMAYLKSGGYLVIEPTEAMTVIDVNSGKAIKGKNSESDLFKINVEAAYEIARQIRLRNLSGIVIIDFISMKSTENQILLVDELKKATASDYVGVTVVDITRLGLVELTRKKIRKPLHEVFSYGG